MTNTVFPIFNQASPIVGTFLFTSIFWPGGDGWLQVSGTFAGATGIVKVAAFPEQPPYLPGSTTEIDPHPDFPSGISAAGLYKFASPKGAILFSSPPFAAGDTLSVSALAISVAHVPCGSVQP
jgi:hypothetical protein